MVATPEGEQQKEVFPRAQTAHQVVACLALLRSFLSLIIYVFKMSVPVYFIHFFQAIVCCDPHTVCCIFLLN